MFVYLSQYIKLIMLILCWIFGDPTFSNINVKYMSVDLVCIEKFKLWPRASTHQRINLTFVLETHSLINDKKGKVSNFKSNDNSVSI